MDARPERNEARLWAFELDIDPSGVDHLAALLSPDELARAGRFVTPELRRRFIVARGRLRQVLSAATAMPPTAIEFSYQKWGKPELPGKQSKLAGNLHFNLSHSVNKAVIALSQAPVGIDIEVANRRVSAKTLENQVICEREQPAWQAVGRLRQQEEILNVWVAKEALLKAMGLGIADGLQGVSLPIPIPQQEAFHPEWIASELQLHLDDDGTCRFTSWIDQSVWRIQKLQQLEPCFAAIAIMRHIESVVFADNDATFRTSLDR